MAERLPAEDIIRDQPTTSARIRALAAAGVSVATEPTEATAMPTGLHAGLQSRNVPIYYLIHLGNGGGGTAMMATRAMITAARRAEYDYYQRRRALGERFIPTPDAVIKAMVQAVLDQLEPSETLAPTAEPTSQKRTVIVAHPPRRRR